jgi:hypothetical protein
MKIAIIQRSFPAVEELQEKINEKQNLKNWKIDYYSNGKEFLDKSPYTYDAVLIDHALEDGSENLLLNMLTEDKIDIAIMNGPSSDWFNMGLVQDDQVNALIDKTDTQNVLDWLNYVDVKHRLTKKLKQESGIYSEIVSNTNGCLFQIKDEVTVLGISRLLSKDRIDVITKSIESTNNKAVLYFTDEIKTVSSSYFGLIVTFWERIVKERKGKMAFWMRDRDDTIVQLANLFCINELFPCFAKLDEAIRYVKRAETKEKRKHENGYFKRSYA